MSWQHRQSIAFRPISGAQPLDTRFPRAVAGEDYDRYVRAMWPQAQRWIRRHWHRIAAHALSIQDAQDVLRCVAAIDVARRLYGQEERLIMELIQTTWRDLGGTTSTPTPEIPSFLVSRR